MNELVVLLADRLGISEQQAGGGAAVLFRAARDKLGPVEFRSMLGDLGGLDELMQKAPDSGGFGRLFGGFASAIGGNNAALITGILAGFARLGLTAAHAKQFVPVIVEFLHGKVGEEAVAALEKALRS